MSAPPPPFDPNQPPFDPYRSPQPYHPSPVPHPAPGYPPAATPGRLGPRLLRRAEPRFGISLGAAGAVLVIAGVLVWGVGYLVSGLLDFQLNSSGSAGFVSASGQSRRFLGAGLSFALVVVGYVVAMLRRDGPLATAGVVAGAAGVPLAITFVSFDITDTARGDLPFSVDAVYVVSIVVWLVSYFVLPGLRGRPFFLGIAAVALPAYLALKASGTSILRTAAGPVTGNGFATDDTGSVVAIGLVFGLAYYAVAAALDRSGRPGAAVGLVYAGFLTTLSGIVAAIPNFKVIGTGVLLVVVGALLCLYGSYAGRRFTAWAWTVGLLAGIGLIVGKLVPHSYTGAGITLIVVGVVVALIAQLASAVLRERPDIGHR